MGVTAACEQDHSIKGQSPSKSLLPGGDPAADSAARRCSMSDEKRDVLEVLKFELDFLEQGGYGRSVRTPWKATATFQDSPTCLNFNDAERPHPCSECLL